MKYAISTRFSKHIIENSPQIATDIIKQETARVIRNEMKRGFRVMSLSDIYFSLYDGDNFVKNIVTAYINAEIYKIPRFVKHHLLKKSRNYTVTHTR